MSNAIDRDFTFASLLRFAFPSIVMMVFLSLYTIVDGFFISRFVGSNALSATNIIFPVINVELAVGIMLATGGSAVVARRMGMGEEREEKDERNRQIRGIAAYRALLAATPIFLVQWVILLVMDVPMAALVVVMLAYLALFGVYLCQLVRLQKEL